MFDFKKLEHSQERETASGIDTDWAYLVADQWTIIEARLQFETTWLRP